jgi:hypothetical protein
MLPCLPAADKGGLGAALTDMQLRNSSKALK